MNCHQNFMMLSNNGEAYRSEGVITCMTENPGTL